jgi:type I restriction enzyme R subunit
VRNENDTCRELIEPQLRTVGWESTPHSLTEQFRITRGRIVVAGQTARRQPALRADYLLKYRTDFSIAVVEAKAEAEPATEGVQQARDYAHLLSLRFGFATNGREIIEVDLLEGTEKYINAFPTPDELWHRLANDKSLSPSQADVILTPNYTGGSDEHRYYQEIAVNRVLEAVVRGQRRVLLVMATGTGKTPTAFQICWKLWSSKWNVRNDITRRPRILYLADRNFLVDDPKDKTFSAFGDARIKIEGGQSPKSRELYFATYQAIAEDEFRPGLYRQYPPDFFDLVIVDECHRGSAKADSAWREILEYFGPACQIGLTATPKRTQKTDSYDYFGEPIYTYSLRQGIEDGFLAPYRVHRVVTHYDAVGYRPTQGELDRYGQLIPDAEYETKDFERVIALRARTQAIAKHLTDFLKSTDRFAKTIVFCVDQEHASDMRQALTNFNSELVSQHPDYVCRVTAAEGQTGRGHLSDFQDLEKSSPVILTTSQLLTTGLDAPTVKNVVLARVINSMTEFKQIIGRGTRVREDYGKMFFNILDYTGTAVSMFADPDFDGEPLPPDEPGGERDTGGKPGDREEQKKFYVDGGVVQVVAHVVYELDVSGNQLRVIQYSDYTREQVRHLYPTADALIADWIDPGRRGGVIEALRDRGIEFEELARVAGRPDADTLDLMCHLAFGAPLRTRRERAEKVKKTQVSFFEQFGPTARAVLEELLDKYERLGASQFAIPDVLQVPPISEHGSLKTIVSEFGGVVALRDAVTKMQEMLYLG